MPGPHTAPAASALNSPGKTDSSAHSRCSWGVHRVVAPVDRRAQRPVSAGDAPGGAEDLEPVIQPAHDLVCGHRPQPDRSELDRERDAVEMLAKPHHRTGGRRGERVSRHRCPCPVQEQLHRVGSRRAGIQRRDHHDVLAWGAERRPARRQDAHVRAGGQQRPGELRACGGEVLAGVEHEQQLGLGQLPSQRLPGVPGRLIGQAERLGDLGGQPAGGAEAHVAQRGQLDQPGPLADHVPDGGRRRQRQPRLAHPGRAAQGHQAVRGKRLRDRGQFPLPAHEVGDLRREVISSLAIELSDHGLLTCIISRSRRADARPAFGKVRRMLHRGITPACGHGAGSED